LFSLSLSSSLSSEYQYPYRSYWGSNYKQCLLGTRPSNLSTDSSAPQVQKNITAIAHLAGYEKLPSNEYEPLMRKLAMMGPISISVDASSWMSYKSGVHTGCAANPVIDHNVQLVGYGTDDDSGLDYWLVRNSWGVEWGEKGYIRIKRTVDEGQVCGVDSSPLDGSGCKNGPDKVTVCGACGILYDTVIPKIA
jgi:cathepsin L